MRRYGVLCDQCYTTLWNKPYVLSFFVVVFFSSVLSQQQEYIATRLHCPRFCVERIKSYELILYNEYKSNSCLQKRFLPQKINLSQIKISNGPLALAVQAPLHQKPSYIFSEVA